MPDKHGETPRGFSLAFAAPTSGGGRARFLRTGRRRRIQMTIGPTFSAALGMVTDRYGIAWMINGD
ncbi:hypothetical protein [Frateuria sp.]|uniref:hypothetical protein n=1 Tax=Frateuria sp. TaxID=2211372 RepID=UPI003F7F1837